MKNAEADTDNIPVKLGEQTIDAIQREYNRIDRNWLALHYKTTVGLLLLAFIVEGIMGHILIRMNMLNIPTERYLLKYLVVPSSFNFFCVLILSLIVRAPRVSYDLKKYANSLCFVLISFSLYTIHSQYTASIYIFAIGIMLTTLYASYPLTGVTALLSIFTIFISDLFIVWDPEKINPFDNPHTLSNYIISIIVIIAFTFACMVVIRFEKKKNHASIQIEAERQVLQRRLRLDEMTGLYNRSSMHLALTKMQQQPSGHSYILAISDIDYFKRVNDNWGHHVGDDCLIEFARILTIVSGPYTPYRYGGDEFCLFFIDTDMETAVNACKQIQKKLENLRFENYPTLHLTVSFGLASLSEGMDAARLFTHADHALYEAKKSRNTIHVFEQEPNA